MAGVREEKLGAVIDRFYEAAAQPELWRTVLHEASLAVGAEGALLLEYPNATSFGGAHSEGLDGALDAMLRGGWHLQNQRLARAGPALRRPLDIITSHCFEGPNGRTGSGPSAAAPG